MHLSSAICVKIVTVRMVLSKRKPLFCPLALCIHKSYEIFYSLQIALRPSQMNA
jgi:hypothetical protein